MKYIFLLLLVANLVINIDNNLKIRKSMADNKAAFDELMSQLDEATNGIADELQSLKDQIDSGGMSELDEDEVREQLTAAITRLKGLAADPENPVPVVEG